MEIKSLNDIRILLSTYFVSLQYIWKLQVPHRPVRSVTVTANACDTHVQELDKNEETSASCWNTRHVNFVAPASTGSSPVQTNDASAAIETRDNKWQCRALALISDSYYDNGLHMAYISRHDNVRKREWARIVRKISNEIRRLNLA